MRLLIAPFAIKARGWYALGFVRSLCVSSSLCVLRGTAYHDRHTAGYYVAPTILSDLPHDSAAWQEEIFGPVLSVATFETEQVSVRACMFAVQAVTMSASLALCAQEAVALANRSAYGLGHAVLSADDDRCQRVAEQLQARPHPPKVLRQR